MKQLIDESLQSRDIKPTAMRQLVLKVLMEQQAAVSQADLELIFEKADRVTLYRTLKIFEEKGLVHSINDGSGSIKYALCHETCECTPQDLHVHFLCTKCNQTFCLHNVAIPSVTLPVNFELKDVSMVVKGICSNCKR